MLGRSMARDELVRHFATALHDWQMVNLIWRFMAMFGFASMRSPSGTWLISFRDPRLAASCGKPPIVEPLTRGQQVPSPPTAQLSPAANSGILARRDRAANA
jgi:hypothetical protein